MSDRDSSLQLANRLASKRLPRLASAIALSAGFTTATLLIIAAGAAGDATSARSNQQTANKTDTDRRLAPGSTYAAAVSAMRGTMNLAAHRESRSAELR